MSHVLRSAHKVSMYCPPPFGDNLGLAGTGVWYRQMARAEADRPPAWKKSTSGEDVKVNSPPRRRLAGGEKTIMAREAQITREVGHVIHDFPGKYVESGLGIPAARLSGIVISETGVHEGREHCGVGISFKE